MIQTTTDNRPAAIPAKDVTMPTLTMATRRERTAFPFLLHQIEGPGAPRWVKLDREELAMGRGEDAEIRLDTNRASRKHAIFRTEKGECTVTDNQSRNGLFLNGIRIHSAILHKKDVVQIADCVFLFHEP